MNTYPQADLVQFINQFLHIRGMSQRGFTESLKELYPDKRIPKGEELDPSILNRLLSEEEGSTKTARQSTLEKIARIVLERRDATVEQLWDVVYGRSPGRGTTLRVGTGFTCWSSFILHMLSDKSTFPPGIEFVFCNEIITDPVTKAQTMVPYFVSSPDDVNELRNPDRDFSARYIAQDLGNLLDKGEIDCAFLLRSTFEQLTFKNLTVPPILHCRTAVGHGTHLYVIRVVKPGSTPQRNELVDEETFDKRMVAYQTFISQIHGKRGRTITIGNSTVDKHYYALIGRHEAEKAMENVITNDIQFDDPVAYKQAIADVAAQMHPEKPGEEPRIQVFIVVAFEPITNLVYLDLAREFKKIAISQAQDAADELPTLVYTNYNVAKMVSDKSAYCLYSQVDVIETPEKLSKANTLLNALSEHVLGNKKELKRKVSNALADIYYPDPAPGDPIDPISRITRMRNALNELEFTNNALPLLDRLTKQIEKLNAAVQSAPPANPTDD